MRKYPVSSRHAIFSKRFSEILLLQWKIVMLCFHESPILLAKHDLGISRICLSRMTAIVARFKHGENVMLIMMTSSNGNIFRVTGLMCGEFTGQRWFPTQRPETRSFDVTFDLRPNKPVGKQSLGWWFETLSCSLWRHCIDRGEIICFDIMSTLLNLLFPFIAHRPNYCIC